MPPLSYSFYTDGYGGTLGEGVFNALLSPATARVNFLVAPREIVADNAEQYLKAICAVIDDYAINGTDGSQLSSVHIGSFSATRAGRSGATTEQSSADRAAYNELALAVPSLLYKGIT